jgi:hypothetical protein
MTYGSKIHLLRLQMSKSSISRTKIIRKSRDNLLNLTIKTTRMRIKIKRMSKRK